MSIWASTFGLETLEALAIALANFGCRSETDLAINIRKATSIGEEGIRSGLEHAS